MVHIVNQEKTKYVQIDNTSSAKQFVENCTFKFSKVKYFTYIE